MKDQRRRRTRTIGIAAAGAVVLAALGGLAVHRMQPAGDCTVERLALPSGDPYSLVSGMDPAGRFVVGRTLREAGTSRLDLLVWHGGEPRRAELPGEGQVPRGVNGNGVVVGTTEIHSAAGPIALRSWVYRDGDVALLPGTEVSEALAVSDSGVVVGTDGKRPVLWRPSAGTPSPLPVPAGAPSEGKAYGISADGHTIVGVLGSGLLRPYVWPAAGKPRELPLPVVGGETATGAIAQSVTGDWVAGMATTRGDDGVPVRWNLRTGQAQAFPEYGLAGGTVSADGRMTAAGGGGRALLVGAQQTTTLRRLGDAAGSRDTAEAISRDGRSVAGNAASAQGGTVPVVWRC
ncbi:hypothetical protein COUCH_28225 [Couchioplanes caeruleus]|uniref:hypothetical protein n=1 Tax=Couchioplanes caeruleus TaxID=56438 RepID=UPI0020BE1615|nr:hypothetical protein [Couchioplanes caeruleus]UQU62900.1 hypothetical protein COUCH_28225 [Couchioplanes caeruleus]